MIWRLISGPARSALLNCTPAHSRGIAVHGVTINNRLFGITQTDAFEETLEPCAVAFGLEPNKETCLADFMKNNKIPAGFLAAPEDPAPIAALLCSELPRFIVGQNMVIDSGQHYSIF